MYLAIQKIKMARNYLISNKIVTAFSVIVFLLMPLYYTLMLEYFNISSISDTITFWTNRKSVFLFSIIIIYLTYFVVFILVKKMWIANLIYGSLVIAISVTNYLKSALTGDKFLPQDLLMIGNAQEIVGFVSIGIPLYGIIFIVLIVLAVFFFWFLKAELPIRFFIRIPVGLVVFLPIIYFFLTPSYAEKIYNKFIMYYESIAIQSSNYAENGFIGAFSLNLSTCRLTEPKDYSKEQLDKTMAGYVSISPDQDFIYPDIIVFLSESFWDPRMLPGSTFSENPLKNYDQLLANDNVLSGNMIVPAVGGGTIRTEFELLTGLSCDAFPGGTLPYNYMTNKEISSFVSYYKELGYSTVGIHSFLEKFYNRNIALPLLGFDNYYGIEELEKIQKDTINEKQSSEFNDLAFEQFIEHFIDINADEPRLLFAISMGGHQPYKDKFETLSITTENQLLNSNDINVFQNYVQCMYNADKALGELVDFIENRSRPTVLLYFGDHLPTLGSNLSAYINSGFYENNGNLDDTKKIYETPYFIYANFALKEGMLTFEGENQIASYNLMNALGSAIGSGKTEYMVFLEEFHKQIPFYNSRVKHPLDEYSSQLLKLQYDMTYNLFSKK